MNEKDRERELGMGRKITRRDFMNGVSIAVASSIVAANSPWLEAFGVPASPVRSGERSELLSAGENRHAGQPRWLLGGCAHAA